jgi:sulfonate transport system substrate-binding protein
MRVRRLLAASLAAALTLGVCAKAKAEPVTIHAGWLVVPNMIFPLMPMKPEVLRHYGKSYVLDLIHFTGTPPQITALSAGQIDLSPLSFSAFAPRRDQCASRRSAHHRRRAARRRAGLADQ